MKMWDSHVTFEKIVCGPFEFFKVKLLLKHWVELFFSSLFPFFGLISGKSSQEKKIFLFGTLKTKNSHYPMFAKILNLCAYAWLFSH